MSLPTPKRRRRSLKTGSQMDLLKETWRECCEIEQVVGDHPEVLVVESLKRPIHFPYVVNLKEMYIELSDKEKENPPLATTKVFVAYDNQPPFDIGGLQLVGTMNTVHFSCAVMRFVNSFKTLSELRLINCSLVAESIFLLSSSLKDSSVSRLYLDENVIEDQNYHVILKENLNLVHLSLRMCRITDVGAKKLAQELKYCHPSHQLLKSLNLNGNLISSEGLSALALALRWNRNLVNLSIAGNCIRDEGGKALAAILTPFQLNEDEMRLRGERICERLLKIKEFVETQPRLPPPVSDTGPISAPPSTGKKIGSPSQQRMSKGSGDRSSVMNYAPFRGTYDEALTFYYEMEKKAIEEIPEDSNPLITDVKELEKGIYFSRGNSSLWYINISYNRLTVNSLLDFMNAVKHQVENVRDFDKGLVRFEFEGNYFDENDPIIEELRKFFTPFKSKISISEAPPDSGENAAV